MESSKSLDENRDMKLDKRFNKKKIISLILKLIVFLESAEYSYACSCADCRSGRFLRGWTKIQLP